MRPVFVLTFVLVTVLTVGWVLAAGAPVAEPGQQEPAEKAFSEFNHHLSGLFLLFMGGLLWLDGAGRLTWGWQRLWPVSLLLLGGYLVVRSDHMVWPGLSAFVASLADAETLQHKLYALVLLALGTIEWARISGRLHRAASLLFFGILVFGGLLMFHHSLLMAHNHHSPKLLPNHLLIGALMLWAAGVKLAWERQWITWRHGDKLWPGTVVVLGLLLVLYTE